MVASPPSCWMPAWPSSAAFSADLSTRRAVGLLRSISRHLHTFGRAGCGGCPQMVVTKRGWRRWERAALAPCGPVRGGTSSSCCMWVHLSLGKFPLTAGGWQPQSSRCPNSKTGPCHGASTCTAHHQHPSTSRRHQAPRDNDTTLQPPDISTHHQDGLCLQNQHEHQRPATTIITTTIPADSAACPPPLSPARAASQQHQSSRICHSGGTTPTRQGSLSPAGQAAPPC